jgi:hypothetical protein
MEVEGGDMARKHWLTLALAAGLTALAPACPVEKYHSVDGRFEIVRLSRDGVYTAEGKRLYSLPSGDFARDAFLSADGNRVTILFPWSLQAFEQGKLVGEIDVPPALAGQFRLGWVDADGTSFFETRSGDLWKWVLGARLTQVAEADLQGVLADPEAEPAAVFQVALQHQVQLHAGKVSLPASGDYVDYRKVSRDAYLAWQAGASLPEVRKHFLVPSKLKGSDFIAEWTASYPYPSRLISEDEWREFRGSLAADNRLDEAVTMFAWASRRQELPLVLEDKRRKRSSKSIPLDSFLALGAAENPQLLAQHLRWNPECSYQYLDYLTTHPCSDAVPSLVEQVNSPGIGFQVRTTLKSQLHVDLGSNPIIWRKWLREPVVTAEEKSKRLLSANDRSGLLWLAKASATPKEIVLPRLVAVKTAKGHLGAPWLKPPYFGINSLSNPWYAKPQNEGTEWCWRLDTGKPIAPLQPNVHDAAVNPDLQIVILETRDSEQKYLWMADGNRVFRLSPINQPQFSKYLKQMDVSRSPWYKFSNFTRRNMKFIPPFELKDLGDHWVWLDSRSKKPIDALAEMNTWQVSNDGQVLVAALKDGLLVLDPKSAKVLQTIRGFPEIQTLAFDSSGKYLAAGSYSQIWVFDLKPSIKLTSPLESELWTGMALKAGCAEILTDSEYWSRKATWERQTGRSWMQPELTAKTRTISQGLQYDGKAHRLGATGGSRPKPILRRKNAVSSKVAETTASRGEFGPSR